MLLGLGNMSMNYTLDEDSSLNLYANSFKEKFL